MGHCRGPRGVRLLCISCENAGGFERDSVIPRLQGLGAVVVLVVIPGGPEGTRAQSHLPLRFFTPSLPGRPPSVMSSEGRCFRQRRGFPGRGPYLQTDLTLIPVPALTCK